MNSLFSRQPLLHPPCCVPEPLYAGAPPVLGLGQLLFTLVLSPSLPKLPCCQLPVMRILFFLVAVLFFLFQAAPAYSQEPSDTLACRQSRGSCSFVPCSAPLVDIGTCRGGKLRCCKWTPSS